MSALRATPGRRLAFALVVGFVVLNLLLLGLDQLTRKPSGPRSSSYATAATGLAAYSDLLRRAGHATSVMRDRPDVARLDPRETIVMLDPSDITRREVEALRDFVERGGRLVAGGLEPEWLPALLRPTPRWRDAPVRAPRALAPVPETAGVTRVRTAGEGAWASGAGALPALGADGRALLLVASVGRGRVALIADPSPIQNRLLARDDNAALGVALAGERGRPVRFAETVHGYGNRRGLAALPTGWKVALGGLLLAALLYLAGRARRLGPPEDEGRDLPPARRAYVDALGAALARTGERGEAAAPVQAAARRRVAERGSLGPDPTDEELIAAGTRLGLSPEQAAAVARPMRDDDDVMLTGTALAHLSETRR